jgi:hypothetical protein
MDTGDFTNRLAGHLDEDEHYVYAIAL